MKVPLTVGVTASQFGDFTASWSVNLQPMLTETGLSPAYLHVADGIVDAGLTGDHTPDGPDRGSIVFQGVQYRVIGEYLWKIVGSTITRLGSVETNGLPVSMDFSFDLLAIASNHKLWYWNPTANTLRQVTDPDLGVVLDVLWVDGYFMTTDGTSLVVTELNDPYSVDPLKYGSSEEDPDPIVALRKVRGEVYAINANTIENFQNVGGSKFPFQRNNGALIPKGGVGTHACTYVLETFAFVGSGRNEALSVYLAGAGTAVSISTSDVDKWLAGMTATQQAQLQLEARVEQNEQRILIHGPDKTFVYSRQASILSKQPIWHVLASGAGGDQPYVGQHLCLSPDGKWYVGSPTGQVGYMSSEVTTHWDAVAGWRFDTLLVYNEGKGGIIRSLELVGLPGRAPFGAQPTCFLSITRDGQTWSVERAISQGTQGQTSKRIQWRPKLRFRNYVGCRFRGANTAFASWTHLEADIEGLAA